VLYYIFWMRLTYRMIAGRVMVIVLESCSSYFLPRLVGHSNASYLVSTGGVFPPTDLRCVREDLIEEVAKVLRCRREYSSRADEVAGV
jgi:enoyl-CoA hydratase/carnithine racemase